MILILNGNIITMAGKNFENGFLYIKEGKIAQIGEMENLPKNLEADEIIDLGGKKLLPGFVDAHTHLGMSEDGVGEEGEDFNEMSDPSTPHLRAIDAIDPMDKTFNEGLRAGVTTAVISPGSANPISGQVVAMKTFGSSIEDMTILEPLAMKFSMGENPKRVYGAQDQAPMSRMAVAGIIRENLLSAKRYLEDKTRTEHEEADIPDFDFKNESLIPVLQRKIKAHFHAHRAYDIQTAIRIAKEFDLDYVIIHGTEGHRIAEYLAKDGCSVVCGPIMGSRSKAELSRLTLESCGIMLKAGVKIAISSDHPEMPTNFLPLSASVLINHGISAEQALRGITYGAAAAVGLEHRVGSLQAGLDADLLVFDGDPLDIHCKPEMIFVNGTKVSLVEY